MKKLFLTDFISKEELTAKAAEFENQYQFEKWCLDRIDFKEEDRDDTDIAREKGGRRVASDLSVQKIGNKLFLNDQAHSIWKLANGLSKVAKKTFINFNEKDLVFGQWFLSDFVEDFDSTIHITKTIRAAVNVHMKLLDLDQMNDDTKAELYRKVFESLPTTDASLVCVDYTELKFVPVEDANSYARMIDLINLRSLSRGRYKIGVEGEMFYDLSSAVGSLVRDLPEGEVKAALEEWVKKNWTGKLSPAQQREEEAAQKRAEKAEKRAEKEAEIARRRAGEVEGEEAAKRFDSLMAEFFRKHYDLSDFHTLSMVVKAATSLTKKEKAGLKPV